MMVLFVCFRAGVYFSSPIHLTFLFVTTVAGRHI